MAGRAVAVWFVIMPVAILNGAVRDVMLAQRLGDPLARAVSCFTLAGAVLAITWIALPWIRPASMAHAWRIGLLWLAMTLAFEFGAGHYLFNTPWPALMADYNLLAGRLWTLVLVATVTAPPIVYRSMQNPSPHTENSAASSVYLPRR